MIEDWMQLLPVIMDEEDIISYAGEDNVARTITVAPHMFEEGKVNIVPDVESMLPEGRGERQSRITSLYANGLFGEPGTPESIKTFFDLSSFPHLDRTRRQGGIDQVTAEQENGRLLRGEDPRSVPLFDWYHDGIHLQVHEEFMKSPEFLKQPNEIREAFKFHRAMHILNIQIKIAGALPAQGDEEDTLSNRGSANGEPGATSAASGGPQGGQPGGNVTGVAPTAAGQTGQSALVGA